MVHGPRNDVASSVSAFSDHMSDTGLEPQYVTRCSGVWRSEWRTSGRVATRVRGTAMSIPAEAVTSGGSVMVSQRVDDRERRPQPPVADAGLHLHRQDVHDADRWCSPQPVPAVVGTATSGFSGPGRRRAGADGLVDVVHQLAVVGGQQVDRLGGVDRRAAADGDEPVPVARVAGVLDGLEHRVVGRLDMHAVEHFGVHAVAAQRNRDPRRRPVARHAGVGDDQHCWTPEPAGRTDLVRRAHPNFTAARPT